MSEDVPYGLVLWASIADMLNIPVPTMKSTIHLAGVLNEIDYFETGWTVEKLGISGMTVEQLTDYLKTGEK